MLLHYRVRCDHCEQDLVIADTGLDPVMDWVKGQGWTVNKATHYRTETRRWGTDYDDLRCPSCQETS